MNTLEHVNYTVTDVEKTASMLQGIFSWRIRWAGPSRHGGNTIHIGGDSQYLALYSRDKVPARDLNQDSASNLNHVGVLVDDLDDIERRVRLAGYTPFNFGDYEPGHRFYFIDEDHIEYEVVSYS
jgi:catechol 2,3-dioxygenase-like lactoylglutathione lyase family enzyme